MKLGIIGYVPPPTFGHPKVFLDNLNKFKTTHEIMLYSDHPWPNVIPLKASPEVIKHTVNPVTHQVNTWAVNNAIFLTGLALADRNKFSHIIYLESDCRIGKDNWDEIIFDEHFNSRLPLVASGTLVCWNPMMNSESARRWNDLICRTNKRRNFPIPTYGYGASHTGAPSIFPNGALGVYDMAWMKRFFDLNNTIELAKASHAWDFVVGDKIWATFGPDAYDMVGNLNCIFSSYGEQVSTEQERLQLLRDGKVVAIHQVKSNATL